MNATFDTIVARTGRLDILVNNAGVAHVGNIERTPEDDFDRLYRVNVKGVYLCSQAAVPVMVRQGGGVILNMASIVSFIGVADRFAYSMTQGRGADDDQVGGRRLRQAERALQLHLPGAHPHAVRRWLRHEELSGPRSRKCCRSLSEYQPMGRMGTPEEVAYLALYLCSDEASFVTGQAYPLDGGVLNQ